MKKVFLGGTCNGSNWRDELIKNIKIDYFNPVVDDWNETAYNEELKQRKICDYLLYIITVLNFIEIYLMCVTTFGNTAIASISLILFSRLPLNVLITVIISYVHSIL